MHQDFAPPAPATYGCAWALHGKPPLNGGSPKKPDPPPPTPAPVRADAEDGTADASRYAARKKGLRRTFLADMMNQTPASGQTLGATTALGSYGNQP